MGRVRAGLVFGVPWWYPAYVPTSSDCDADANLVWRFLAVSDPPARADVIFVFGGADLAVPRHAAALFAQHYASVVLCSGRAGPLTPASFAGSEAETFAQDMVARGVPNDAILIEPEATNTGQNVQFGMRTLIDHGIMVRKALLVAKPFLMRRCIATFAKQCPNVEAIASPPPGDMRDFLDRSWDDFVARLPAELSRLADYAERGFIAPVEVPQEILAASARLEGERRRS